MKSIRVPAMNYSARIAFCGSDLESDRQDAMTSYIKAIYKRIIGNSGFQACEILQDTEKVTKSKIITLEGNTYRLSYGYYKADDFVAVGHNYYTLPEIVKELYLLNLHGIETSVNVLYN